MEGPNNGINRWTERIKASQPYLTARRGGPEVPGPVRDVLGTNFYAGMPGPPPTFNAGAGANAKRGPRN